MSLVPPVLLALGCLLLVAQAASAHESADHGAVVMRAHEIDEASGDPPHFTCHPYFDLVGMDSAIGWLDLEASPMADWAWMTRFDRWNASDHDLYEPPFDLQLEPFSPGPVGYYEVRAIIGDEYTTEPEHATLVTPFYIDGPCGPPIQECPADVAASLQDDGSIVISWTDAETGNGTTVQRRANNDDLARWHRELPPQTNRLVDANAYAGATFHYLVEPSYDGYWLICDEVSVVVPGPRTFFPCPTEVDTQVSDEVEVYWNGPEGLEEVRLYRASGGGPFELIDVSPYSWWSSYTDAAVAEGDPYTYVAVPAFKNGEELVEATGCPTASLETGWEYRVYTYPPEGSPPTAPPSAPGGSDEDETAEVPNFPSTVAAILAVAGSAFGYILMQRRRDLQ